MIGACLCRKQDRSQAEQGLATSMYDKPRNRMPSELPILKIEIEHAGGIETTDPNGACASAVFNATGEDLNGQPGAAGLKMNIIDLRKIEPIPGKFSVLFVNPAFLYRSHDLEILLSREEFHRLMDLSLRPNEFFKLREIYGIFL
jgi:hypothetical protein